MSGIAGLFYLDGRPVERIEIERMTNSLAHRGMDDAGLWCEGSVGLGHRMLWTTPESLQEKLPLVDSTGNLAITADARIDNRDELIPLLGFSDRPAEDVADSQLILAAYEKWGEQCPEKLLGDFAFAIWDGRRQTLFCARDYLGDRPFYYYQSDQLFIFGSEIKALFCNPQVPRQLNELMVGCYLSNHPRVDDLTFYQDIYHFPPAHSMTVNATGIQWRRYWSPDPVWELRLGSDEEYAEGFQEVLRKAVQCRLRSAFPVGSELSGGLDSSAVTCMARDLLLENGKHPLATFSAVYDETPESDERVFINPVVNQGNIEPHYVYMDDVSPFVAREQHQWLGDEVYAAFAGFISWEVCRQVHKQGVRILLDGVDGDTTISYGYEYLNELARAARWTKFGVEARALAKRSEMPLLNIINGFGFSYLSESAHQWRWGAFAGGVNGLSKEFGLSRRYLVEEYGLKSVIPNRVWQVLSGHSLSTLNGNGHQFINSAFAQRIALKERLGALSRQESSLSQTAREEHAQAITHSLSHMLEFTNKEATAFSLERRHPLADKRLVEFCLALPPEQKLHDGWARMIMRRGLAGILPPKVQWRTGKTLNSTAFTRALLKFEDERFREVIMNNPGELGAYVDLTTLRKTYRRYLSQQEQEDEIKLWRAVTLALWLRDTGLTPQNN